MSQKDRLASQYRADQPRWLINDEPVSRSVVQEFKRQPDVRGQVLWI